MVKKTGKLVITSIGIGAVGSTLSSSLNVPQGNTMTAKMLEGTTKVIQPTLKVKAATKVVKSVGKLNKASKKLTKGIF